MLNVITLSFTQTVYIVLSKVYSNSQCMFNEATHYTQKMYIF